MLPILLQRMQFHSLTLPLRCNSLRYGILKYGIWGLILLLMTLGMPLSAHAVLSPAPIRPAPGAQSATSADRIEPPLLTPWEATTVTLLTHTADFTLLLRDSATASADLLLTLDATYRFENEGDTPVTVNVRIADATDSNMVNGVTLAIDGVPVSLYQTTGVGYAAQFQINADARATARLQYQLNLAELPLPLLSYQVADLAAWPGNPSLRVSVTMPEQVNPESWLHIAPEGWQYATTSSADSTGIKWLYDAQIPQIPFLFEFIHPNQWLQLQQLAEQATLDATAYLPLGNGYRALLDATPLSADYRAVRERFYAQALAAYSTGIDALPDNERRGELYAALAALYRLQVAQPDNSIHADYATAMIEAAQRALAQLPAADNRRQELSQWVIDGLQIALVNAQEQEDWASALRTIEQLSALPPELVNADMLEQTKRTVTVRQALQLLEEENRVGAIALAGEELLNSALLPAPEQMPLFRRWEISTTVSPTTMELVVTPFAIDARTSDASDALRDLVATLQMAAEGSIGVEWQPMAEENSSGGAVGQLLIRAPTDTSFASLTTAIPPAPNWALLYTLLRQLQPTVDSQAELFQRTTQIRLVMDLQAADEAWRTVAADLAATATGLEADAANRNPRDANEAERALQLRIQAANYRSAAQAWQTIGRDSWVAAHLLVPAGLQETAQTWLLTATSPPTTLTLQSAPSYATSFMSVLIVAIGALLFLSGLLWWLL